MSPEDFLKLLKEKRYSLDGKEKYSLIRLEKVSAISESNDRKILVVKGRMIVKRKKILAIDFNSCIFISQIGLLKDYGFFPEEFECQRKFGFY